MTEPRPKFSAEIALAAAKELAGTLAREGQIDPKDVDASAIDIAEYAEPHMDGYEIARTLENRVFWDCDLELANTLDSFAHLVNLIIAAAEKEWAARNDIKPPLECGTRVTLRSAETGTIDRIYEYGAAKYCIAIDQDSNAVKGARRIVNFEDVSPA